VSRSPWKRRRRNHTPSFGSCILSPYQDPLVILHSYVETKCSSEGLLPVSMRKLYHKVHWLLRNRIHCEVIVLWLYPPAFFVRSPRLGTPDTGVVYHPRVSCVSPGALPRPPWSRTTRVHLSDSEGTGTQSPSVIRTTVGEDSCRMAAVPGTSSFFRVRCVLVALTWSPTVVLRGSDYTHRGCIGSAWIPVSLFRGRFSVCKCAVSQLSSNQIMFPGLRDLLPGVHPISC